MIGAETTDKAQTVRSTEVETFPLPWQLRLLLWGFILPFAFDYKGAASGGSFIQYAIAGISLLSGLLFIVQPKEVRGSRALQFFTFAWWLFLAISVLTTLIGSALSTTDTDFGRYIRAALPYIYAGVALSVVQTLFRRLASLGELVTPLLVAGILSSLFRYYYARHGLGIETEQLRYQILSPLTLIVLPLVITNILFHKKINKLGLLAALIMIGALMISVTRTYVLVAGFWVIGIAFCLILLRGQTRAYALRRSLLLSFLIVVLGVTAFGLALVVRPKIVQAWLARTTGPSRTRIDPSLLSRQAASSGIWKEVRKDTFSLTMGKGFGASYRSDPRFAPEYIRVIPIFPTTPFSNGMDSVYMTTLLYNGLLMGGVFFGLCAFAAYYSVLAVRKQTLEANPLGQWAAFPFFVIIAHIPVAYLGDPLIERYGGLLMGLTFGVAIVIGASTSSEKLEAKSLERGDIRAA